MCVCVCVYLQVLLLYISKKELSLHFTLITVSFHKTACDITNVAFRWVVENTDLDFLSLLSLKIPILISPYCPVLVLGFPQSFMVELPKAA